MKLINNIFNVALIVLLVGSCIPHGIKCGDFAGHLPAIVFPIPQETCKNIEVDPDDTINSNSAGDLNVYVIESTKMSHVFMSDVARAWKLNGVFVRKYGGSPEEYDTWECKDNEHSITLCPDTWSWEYNNYNKDNEPNTKHELKRISTIKYSMKDLDCFTRMAIDNPLLLPRSYVLDPFAITMETTIGSGETMVSAVTSYCLIFRNMSYGYQFLGNVNACIVNVGYNKNIINAAACNPPLRLLGQYSSRPIDDAFKSLISGHGQHIFTPFNKGKASYSGLYYWTIDKRIQEVFQPVYRFQIINKEGRRQYFFIPALCSKYYKNGKSSIYDDSIDMLPSDRLEERIKDILCDIHKHVDFITKSASKGMNKMSYETLIVDKQECINELLDKISSNYEGSLRHKFDNRILLYAKDMYEEADAEYTKGEKSLSAAKTLIGNAMLEKILKNGSDEMLESIETLNKKYKLIIDHGTKYIFGLP